MEENTPEVVSHRDPLFVAEYIANGGNGTKAMMKVDPSLDEKSAAVASSRALRKSKVAEAVEAGLRAQIKRTEISGDRVIRELYRILTADVADAFNDDGSVKPIKDIPEDVRRAISAIETDEIWEMTGDGPNRQKVEVGITKRIKFWSKTEAAQLLGRHLKLWIEKVGVGGVFEGPNGERIAFTLDIST